jgi:hypothetical protein
VPATEERVIASCSFCLKPNTAVKKLVAGPGVYICDECVALCVVIIEAELAERDSRAAESEPRLAPWERQQSLDDVLRSLPAVAAAGTQVERNLVQWVLKARALGASWARVGGALGMTRQSAWERFSPEE